MKKGNRYGKVFKLSGGAKSSAYAVPNALVLSTFPKLIPLFNTVFENLKPDMYNHVRKHNRYGQWIQQRFKPNSQHPLFNWCLNSRNNREWLVSYMYTMFDRYKELRPSSRLTQAMKTLIPLVYNDREGNTFDFPYEQMGLGSTKKQDIIRKLFFNKYKELGVFGIRNAAYPMEFKEYMIQKGIKYVELAPLESIYDSVEF